MVKKQTPKPKQLRAIRKGQRWDIKLGSDLLYFAFVDHTKRTFIVAPVPDTHDALETGRRYYKDLMGGSWRGADPDGARGEIKSTDRIARLEEVRSLCLPFPNIGDHVTFPHPKSGEPSNGIVSEVSRNRRKVWKAWVRTAEGQEFCVLKSDLKAPDIAAKGTAVGE